MKTGTMMLTLLMNGLMAVGCSNMKDHDDAMTMHISEGVAVMHGTQGNEKVNGTVRFSQQGEKVHVVVDLQGLAPNGTHAIHVHEFGDCTAGDATSAGGHYNPTAHKHALPSETEMRHAGDLGNLTADAKGNAHYEITVDNITVAGGMNPVLGRAVILHADSDKGMAEQPTGAAGARLACGVIGVAKQ